MTRIPNEMRQRILKDRPDVAQKRAEWKLMQVGLNPKKPVFLDETSAKTNMTRLYGRAPKGKRLVDKTPRTGFSCDGMKPVVFDFRSPPPERGERNAGDFVVVETTQNQLPRPKTHPRLTG